LWRRSRRYLRQSPGRNGKGEHPHRYSVHGSHLLGRCHGRLQATSPTRYRPTLFPPRDHDSRQALVRSRAARVARVDDGPAGLVLSFRCEPGQASAFCAGPSVCSLNEMATMTDNDPAGSTPPGEEPALSRQQDPDASRPAEDPRYLTVTGEAAAEDGSVAPIIGGLLAVEGSWPSPRHPATRRRTAPGHLCRAGQDQGSRLAATL
jgi:hypothetical protein